jgi:hypothetical protein
MEKLSGKQLEEIRKYILKSEAEDFAKQVGLALYRNRGHENVYF